MGSISDIVAVGLVAAGAFAVVPAAADACGSATQTPGEIRQDADVMFEGVVLQTRDRPRFGATGGRRTTIQVTRRISGKVGRWVDIFSPITGPAGGLRLPDGRRAVFAASMREGRLWTSSCILRILNKNL